MVFCNLLQRLQQLWNADKKKGRTYIGYASTANEVGRASSSAARIKNVTTSNTADTTTDRTRV